MLISTQLEAWENPQKLQGALWTQVTLAFQTQFKETAKLCLGSLSLDSNVELSQDSKRKHLKGSYYLFPFFTGSLSFIAYVLNVITNIYFV